MFVTPMVDFCDEQLVKDLVDKDVAAEKLAAFYAKNKKKYKWEMKRLSKDKI